MKVMILCTVSQTHVVHWVVWTFPLKERRESPGANMKHFYVKVTFPRDDSGSWCPPRFHRCSLGEFHPVIYSCQIRLGLAEHFTAAKQHERGRRVCPDALALHGPRAPGRLLTRVAFRACPARSPEARVPGVRVATPAGRKACFAAVIFPAFPASVLVIVK